jgi:group I intron endonuclease
MIKCGIYKITNPSGAIYIGKSKNIISRFKDYKHLKENNKQTKIYNSLQKYGWIKHTFEIIEECSEDILNEREIYWIEYCDSYHHNNKIFGLNLTKGGEGGNGTVRTEQMKINHSLKIIGKIKSIESKLLISKTLSNKPKPINFGNKLSIMSNRSQLEKIEKNKNPNHYLSNKTRPQWVKDKIKEGMKLNKKPKDTNTIEKMRKNSKWNKCINQFDLQNNFIKEWVSQSEAGRFYNIDSTGIYACCKGKQKTAAGYIWKYK